MTPLVSILIPCYNAAPWLAATLESALAQTWPRIEIVVVDDGSTDESLAIARGFEARGIRAVAQPNSGASAARNQALLLSQGEFIQFLDADDLLSPDKIAEQVGLLGRSAAGPIASCAWGRFSEEPESAQFMSGEVYRDFNAVEFLMLAGATGAMMHPAAWLTPRSVAARAGTWNEALSVNDDGEYFCRVLLAAGASIHSAKGLVYYRSGNRTSLSQQRTERARRSHYYSLRLIESHLRAAEESPRTRQALADYYQRFVFDYYPWPADLIISAEKDIARLGGSSLLGPAMGPRTAALANLIGWRNTWRIKHWVGTR